MGISSPIDMVLDKERNTMKRIQFERRMIRAIRYQKNYKGYSCYRLAESALAKDRRWWDADTLTLEYATIFRNTADEYEWLANRTNKDERQGVRLTCLALFKEYGLSERIYNEI